MPKASHGGIPQSVQYPIQWPRTSYDEQVAAANEAYEIYYAEYERLAGDAETEDDIPQEDLAYLDGLYADYALQNTLAQYYSMADMLDRLKAHFSVDHLALVVPDEQEHAVSYVAEGAGADQTRGQGGVHALGNVEERPAADYPQLWATVEAAADGSLAVQPGVELSRPTGRSTRSTCPSRRPTAPCGCARSPSAPRPSPRR